jgi:hypothetical protein
MSTVRVPELINWLESRKKATLAYFGEVLLPNTGVKYQALWNRMVSARKLEVYVNPEAVESIVFAYIAVIRQGRGDEKTKNPNLEDLQKAHAPMAKTRYLCSIRLFHQTVSLKQTHATDLFLEDMGSSRLTDGDARSRHSTGR